VPLDWIGCEETARHLKAARWTTHRIWHSERGTGTPRRYFAPTWTASRKSKRTPLMTSGYRMTEHYLPKVEVLPTHVQEARDWDFLAIERVPARC